MYKELLDFWFSEKTSKYWFKSTRTFDQALVATYEATWLEAQQGKLEHWQESASGSLALVIVLDQFPLNMYRGQAKCFSTESQSREVAGRALEKGFDNELDPSQKSFLYMPYMHSEDLADQALSVELFNLPGLENNYRFAQHHYSIVERFGRFPHRNKILARKSTDAEIEYLNSKQGFQG